MVGEAGVQHKKYESHCTKHWIIIPKATWTSPILGRKSTFWTSSNMASLMKDDVNDEMPNGIPKIIIPMMGW